MDEEEFRKFLENNKIEKETIEVSIKVIKEFDEFLQKRGNNIDTASPEDFYEYSVYLINQGQNTFENYVSILRYGLFKNSNDLYVAVMEVLDGREVMENLSKRLIEEFGEDFRNEIFEKISLPPLGIHPKEKPEYTKKLIPRLEEKLGVKRCTEFLNQGLRDRYEEGRKPDREKFLKSKNIDEFLENKHWEYIKELEQHYKEGSLYFTQEITKEVLELIKNDPSIEVGIREGDTIIAKKIPHMAKEYLKETDEQKKRYYYCHCPWVKEALLESKQPISPIFCNCSAGYYKVYWEIVLDQPVQVEVVESILKGDSVCTFAIHLPQEVVGEDEFKKR
ncbi:MAG: hypothetical protein KAT49_04045 [Methanomicrobia archaeon]|nr:hypothetical protein [Methanomicrobia archaeon]